MAVLRQVEAGARVAEVCRKAGISEATYYLWKRQYSGVGVSELRELRQLREDPLFENVRKIVDTTIKCATNSVRYLGSFPY